MEMMRERERDYQDARVFEVLTALHTKPEIAPIVSSEMSGPPVFAAEPRPSRLLMMDTASVWYLTAAVVSSADRPPLRMELRCRAELESTVQNAALSDRPTANQASLSGRC